MSSQGRSFLPLILAIALGLGFSLEARAQDDSAVSVTGVETGTVLLNGADSYTGVTTIDSGTLEVTDTDIGTSGSGAVTDDGDATLSVSNTDSGSIVLNTISGDSVLLGGTVTITGGTITLSSAGTISSGSSLSLGGLTVTSAFGESSSGTMTDYTILYASGSTGVSGVETLEGAPVPVWPTESAATSSALILSPVAVPEPMTSGMLVMAAAFLFWLRRRVLGAER